MKLSVITINLNNKDGLERTIKSVVNQRFTDYEYIIIDGNSSDGSKDLLEKVALEHQIKWISEKDCGIYNAMNKGILLAQGEYLLFMNSGDYLYDSEVLSTLFINDITEDVVLCNSLPANYYGIGKKGFGSIQSSDITFNDLYLFGLNHQATLIKRALFSKFGLYDEKFKIISDRIFIIKVLGLNNSTFRYVDLVISRYDTTGVSSNIKDYLKSELEPAIKEILPYRILLDYQNGYLHAVYEFRKHPFLWFGFRILLKLLRFLKKK